MGIPISFKGMEVAFPMMMDGGIPISFERVEVGILISFKTVLVGIPISLGNVEVSIPPI